MSNRGLVRLNVYDLAEQNAYLYWAGVGIFHSGVEVYGVEFAYGDGPPLFLRATSARASLAPYDRLSRGHTGGHEYDASGVFATNPRDAPGPGRDEPGLRAVLLRI